MRKKSGRRALSRAMLSLVALALLLSLAACGAQGTATAGEPKAGAAAGDAKAPAKDTETAAEESEDAEATAAPTPRPKPTPAPDTPAGRAAALGLPEPPDVDITEWRFMVANSHNSISEYYMPAFGGIEGQGIDPRIQEQAYNFMRAAQLEGYHCFVAKAYRTFEFLINWYRNLIVTYGSAAEVYKVWLGPGVSEHQTGLCLDYTDKVDYNCWYYEPFENEGFGDTELYRWLHDHCTEYGFIDRYPEGKEMYYGTPCCKGHFRYVGEDAAKYIMENDLCLEEFVLLYDPNAIFVPGLN